MHNFSKNVHKNNNFSSISLFVTKLFAKFATFFILIKFIV